MPAACIYLDESGDLGWKFDAAYRQGGSSRYLTIAAVITPSEKSHLPKRVIQQLYKKYTWPTIEEKKWVNMQLPQKVYFGQLALNLVQKHPDIHYKSITVYKPNVYDHIRADSNKLYNYMINLLLLDNMVKFDEIAFMPDPRSIKVKSGNSLCDYLQTQLWFEKQVKTRLNYYPCDSNSNRGIQFTDMLSGIIQQHFEDAKSDIYSSLKAHINVRKLYFPQNRVLLQETA